MLGSSVTPFHNIKHAVPLFLPTVKLIVIIQTKNPYCGYNICSNDDGVCQYVICT